MTDLARASVKPAPPVTPAATRAAWPPASRPRPATPARREVLRELRDQVVSGTYQPPVDALSAALAAWLLCDGLPDRGGT